MSGGKHHTPEMDKNGVTVKWEVGYNENIK